MAEQRSITLTDLKELIRRISDQGRPEIQFILKAGQGVQAAPEKLGVFSSSFNPPTIAHVEIVRKAQQTFLLKEILLLVGLKNADKANYEATLEERVEMLLQVYRSNPAISIGISSHPYFADMVQAIQACYSQGTEIYFIVGYDTLERILDKEGKYYPHYYKTYKTREESLKDLFNASHFVVIGRKKYGLGALQKLLADEVDSNYLAKIHYLELPDPYPWISATEVRNRIKQGLSVEELVPPEVQRYLQASRLYTTFF